MGETGAYGLSPEALLSLGSMEGVYEFPVVEKKSEVRSVVKPAEIPVAGYAAAVIVAAIAYGAHQGMHLISASILAILLGAAARNLLPIPGYSIEAAKRIVKRVLPLTIILTGSGLNLVQVSKVGLPVLGVILLCIAIATLAAVYVGRILGLSNRAAVLIGAGTAICGNSAIVAVAPLIEAEDDDVTLSVGAINVLGLLLMMLLPALGVGLGLGDQAFGVWAGTTIHAVPQAVAAGFTFSEDAGAIATAVKLCRVTMLAPFVFVLGMIYAKRKGGAGDLKVNYARIVPNFLWGFLALSVLYSIGALPVLVWGAKQAPLAGVLKEAGEILLTLCMAAMGLEVNVRFLARVGGRAMIAGAIACVTLCAASLLLIKLLL